MKIKAKTVTIIMVVIMFIIGIVLVFLPEPTKKMEAFKIFALVVLPYVLPIMCGISLKSIVKQWRVPDETEK